MHWYNIKRLYITARPMSICWGFAVWSWNWPHLSADMEGSLCRGLLVGYRDKLAIGTSLLNVDWTVGWPNYRIWTVQIMEASTVNQARLWLNPLHLSMQCMVLAKELYCVNVSWLLVNFMTPVISSPVTPKSNPHEVCISHTARRRGMSAMAS